MFFQKKILSIPQILRQPWDPEKSKEPGPGGWCLVCPQHAFPLPGRSFLKPSIDCWGCVAGEVARDEGDPLPQPEQGRWEGATCQRTMKNGALLPTGMLSQLLSGMYMQLLVRRHLPHEAGVAGWVCGNSEAPCTTSKPWGGGGGGAHEPLMERGWEEGKGASWGTFLGSGSSGSPCPACVWGAFWVTCQHVCLQEHCLLG